MHRFTFALLSASLCLALAQAPSVAQTNDHLKCYKIIDPLKLKGIVDLHSPQFGLEAKCRIERPELFCVPATKRVRKVVDEATDPKTPITPLPIFGPPAQVDRICYRLKCKTDTATLDVVDQFGRRTVQREHTELLCTPAFKGEPPPPPCESSEAPTCGGVCPDRTQECVPTATGCRCEPPKCEESDAPECGGICPTGLRCQSITDDSGTVHCRCEPPPCEGTFPQCGGACPPDEHCLPVSGTTSCACQPTCRLDDASNAGCGGACPPGLTCQLTDTAGCRCLEPPPPPCGLTAAGCGGACPAGSTCQSITGPNGVGCGCVSG